MTVKYDGCTYEFRGCDTKNITQERLQEIASEKGKKQYDSNYTWLNVPGIGYGWKVK